MTSTPKAEKHGPSETSKSGKLARRARSFKEDFLDILSQMRSPSGGGGSSGSPKPPRSPKPRTSSTSDSVQEERNPLSDLDSHVKQVQIALKHFRDVVSKNKLEVLPGNGTIVLEGIATIQSLLKTYVFADQSNAVISATNQVYQSLTSLIKLCDEVLLGGQKALDKQNVTEVLEQVEEAVQNLVSLVRSKIAEQKRKMVLESNLVGVLVEKKGFCEPPMRNSLPDISLTPRERQVLEETSKTAVTYSTESIPDTPPPKPPLPSTRIWAESPPPLPPKKRNQGPPSHSMERLSLRSDTSSLGSLDSMLNTSSKDEEELRAIMDEENNSINLPDSSLLSQGLGSGINGSQNSSCWDSSCSNVSDRTHLTESPDPPPSFNNTISCLGIGERLSNSSGFISIVNSSQTCNYSSKSRSISVAGGGDGKTSTKLISASEHTVSTSFVSTTTSAIGQVDVPPALPEKKRLKKERQLSMYDNIPSGSPTDTKPPPLPPKKRHIMAYMEMFGNCPHPSESELLRHSSHFSHSVIHEWSHHHPLPLTSTQSCSFPHSTSPSFEVREERRYTSRTSKSVSSVGGCCAEEEEVATTAVPPALPPKRSRLKSPVSPPPPPSPPPASSPPPLNEAVECEAIINGNLVPVPVEVNPLLELDITKLLVFKRPEEEGPDIRGGHLNALIVHAINKVTKNDFLYREAFLTTYRTFMHPLDLIEKLCLRQQRLSASSDSGKQRAARETSSLLVRVVSDLTVSDLDDPLVQTLMEFVYQLLSCGDLSMARALRVIILEKYNNKQLYNSINNLLSSQNIYTRQSTLLDFKSEQIAEQMTLLDSELFMKIEIPEVLIWAQEQNEERSPNLTQFTEHFNKMSYWARSRILEQSDAKDRERYVVKFIKIMKHLRKINNFNSYLALLSALDSAPIRRLEWHKQITEGLKEYCALIDSSSSFRAYRQALAETQPPCIPYIGLVLQDLTFVHIGNSDFLSEGVINFSKRWQQYNIVENMKKFKKGTYSFKKNERIIAFFSNFDDFLSEEAMWQISESIKPRGSKKAAQ